MKREPTDTEIVRKMQVSGNQSAEDQAVKNLNRVRKKRIDISSDNHQNEPLKAI